jgi:hypothetical protein
MLVELNLSVWTAAVIDKRVTDDVLVANGASSMDAGKFRKNLMAGSTLRKEIADFAAGCRLWHHNHTMPWADRGSRLLPTSMFLEYKAELDKRKMQFFHMVEQFEREYPALCLAAPSYLGGMYNANDYPTLEEMRDKFGFRVMFTPLPESGDFRLDIPQEEIQALSRQYDDAQNERLKDAMQSQWGKMHDMLLGMVDKLTDPDGDTEVKRRWYDSFLTNAHELCGLLTHMNIAKDPQLDEARVKLQAALGGVDIDDIKESAGVRADVRSKLDNILKDYEW